MLEQEEIIIGFQGYKGGFINKGKGTSQGDGKDKAMRKVADLFIGEIVKNKSVEQRSSSTEWSAFEIAKGGNKQITVDKKTGTVITSYKNSSNIPDSPVVMLARNSKLSGKSLDSTTKQNIYDAHKFGASFVVGDMPNVDSQFIDYLQEIGANFTVYHTGDTSRIEVKDKPIQTKLGLEETDDLVNKEINNLGTTVQDYMGTLSPELRQILRDQINNDIVKFKCK